jgi:TatD DNase family protein
MKEMTFIDTHCHLDMKEFREDLPEVLDRAVQAGVEYVLNVGSDFNGCERTVDLARNHTMIFGAVGIHPHDAKTYDRYKEEKIIEWLDERGMVALGEIGLDYHYDHSPRDVQRRVFERQLQIAVERDLPVVIHSREAEDETMRILDQSGLHKGVMHCFSGGEEMAERALALGLHISFAGPVTFKNAKGLKEVARKIPDERLLIETDAPYLSPVPYRGMRNEPARVVETAKVLASLRGVGLEDIARITTLNAKMLFGIGEIPGEGEIAYRIRDNLYLNLTNRCSNVCGFCVRFHTDYVKGHNLRLSREPSLEELKTAIGNPLDYREVVFCGYGEPLLRFELLKDLALWIKKRGGRVRVNTNGHGNMIHRRNILPELEGLVDSISISLNAHDDETYRKICRPRVKDAFKGVMEFIREATRYIPEVTVTVVDMEGVDLDACRRIAEDSGVRFRVRRLDSVG